MNKVFRKLGSIVLMLCMIASLSPFTAFAESTEYYSDNITGTVGSEFYYSWSTPDSENIGSSGIEEGYLPDGLYLDTPGSNTQPISGTPTQSGIYDVKLRVDTADHIYYVDLTVTINTGDKPEMTVNQTLSGQVGTALSNWTWGTPDYENIGDVYVSSGSLPEGLSIPTPGSNAIQITGTPTTAGTSYCTITVETADNIFYIDLQSNISEAEFKITKSPTSESTQENGSATFIATATNYSYVEWLLISGGSTMGTFKGETNTMYSSCNVVAYKDSGKEYLVLKNIPVSMNGYTIQARFTNSSLSSSILTQSCSLNVTATELKTPSISTQPTAAKETIGKSIVLTVAATDPNNGTLSYQWYSNTAASTAGGTIINGATSASYTVPQTEGTIYYYCRITSTKDGKTSAAVTTSAAEVTYSSANASPSPSPSVSPSPNTEVSPSPVPSAKDSKGNSSGLLVLLIVLILLSAAALIFLVLYMRKKGDSIEENAEGTEEATVNRVQKLRKWECPECGARNRAGSRFCSECGAANPTINISKK